MDLHVFQKIHSDFNCFLVEVYTRSGKQGSFRTSLSEHFKVNPWDHKKMWNCLLNTQRVMKHIGFLPPAEGMFAVQPFSLNTIWFIQFGCLTKSSETNRLFWEECGGYFTALIYSVKWKNKTVGKHPRVMVSVHFDWKKHVFFYKFRWLSLSKIQWVGEYIFTGALIPLVHHDNSIHGRSASSAECGKSARRSKKVDFKFWLLLKVCALKTKQWFKTFFLKSHFIFPKIFSPTLNFPWFVVSECQKGNKKIREKRSEKKHHVLHPLVLCEGNHFPPATVFSFNPNKVLWAAEWWKNNETRTENQVCGK